MKIEIEVTDEMISNLLCGAFEGGSNYWLSSTRCEMNGDRVRADRTTIAFEKGGAVVCVLGEAHDKAGTLEYRLDRAALERGLAVLRKDVPYQFAQIVHENDDADTADCFLQACLFGKIVYG